MGVCTTTVQGTQWEPLTLKCDEGGYGLRMPCETADCFQMGPWEHWGALQGERIVHCPPSGPAPVPGMTLLAFVGCDSAVAGTVCSAVGDLLCFANWLRQGFQFQKMRSQPLFPCLWAALPRQNPPLTSWTYPGMQGLMPFTRITCLN